MDVSQAPILGNINTTASTIRGTVWWNGKPIIDDDDGGTAGVREPRRPKPSPLAPAAVELCLSDR